MRSRWSAFLLLPWLGFCVVAQTRASVLHDEPGDGRCYALGATWKASFGADGFTYVPYFGPDAERNHPLQFRLRSLCVGGRDVPLAAPRSRRDGDVLWLDHGPLRERFVLAPDRVEHSFVIDGDLPGDVEFRVAVTTDLVEDAERDGLQFGCALGHVSYGEAFVLGPGGRTPIATNWTDGMLSWSVPASLRSSGDVVVDPIVQTHSVTFQGPIGVFPNGTPDVSFDAALGAYLVAYESRFSAADTDVLCQLMDSSGIPIGNATAAIDISSARCSWPGVSDFPGSDGFVVVVQFQDAAFAQGRSQIMARACSGTGPLTAGPLLAISDPSQPGAHVAPSVSNGETGSGGSLALVAWTHQPLGAPLSLHGQRIRADGTTESAVELVLASSSTTPSFNASVARSVGRFMVPIQAWCVAFTRLGPGGDGDVCAIVVGRTGIGPLTVVDGGPHDDQFPQISCPVRGPLGTGDLDANHLITYTRVDTGQARAAVFDRTFASVPRLFDLGNFGFGQSWLRTDADGARFVVVGSHPSVPSTLVAGTFAYDGNALHLQDGPHALSGGSVAPRVCADRASGGDYNAYMIARVDAALSMPTTRVTGYSGHAPGTQVLQRSTGCNGLSTAWSGGVRLGETFQLQLSGFGTGIPGFVLGSPTAQDVPLCGVCAIGVDLGRSIATVAGSPSLSLPIPAVSDLVGAQFAVQGFCVVAGGCLGSFHTADTFELTIR